jgi:hypothetical protein
LKTFYVLELLGFRVGSGFVSLSPVPDNMLFPHYSLTAKMKLLIRKAIPKPKGAGAD